MKSKNILLSALAAASIVFTTQAPAAVSIDPGLTDYQKTSGKR